MKINQEKEKNPENFFKFIEEENIPQKAIAPKIPVNEKRRTSMKIIENSGITRNLGEANGFHSYISTKPINSLLLISNNKRDSLINTSKLKDSENLPMNSVLNQVFPCVRFYKSSFENEDKEEPQVIENTVIQEPNFKKTSFVRAGTCSKEECDKINEKLSENLMNEILIEGKNSPTLEKRKEEDPSNTFNKTLKRTIVNRPNREFSTYLDSLEKKENFEEGLNRTPSKRDFVEDKNNEKGKKNEEIERKISKKRLSKPKIGISELDFIKINSKTHINEKLAPTNFKERKDEDVIMDEDLMISSATSMGVFKEKLGEITPKPNNLFLESFKEDKRENYFMKQKSSQENKKKFDIMSSLLLDKFSKDETSWSKGKSHSNAQKI